MVRKVRNVLLVSVLTASVLLLSGCGGLDIKHTGGITNYLIKQARCEMLAIKIKEKYPDPKSEQYKKAEGLFNDAAAVANGTIAQLIVAIKTSHVVDISNEDFKTSDINGKMQAFLSLDNELFPPALKAELTPTEAVSIAKDISGLVADWQDRVDKETDAGLKVMDDEWFSRVYWSTFDKTTADSFSKKWTK